MTDNLILYELQKITKELTKPKKNIHLTLE